jgi:penicillin-binding protein 2
MVFFVGYSDQSIRAGRARWLTAFALSAFAACILRLIFLQLIRGEALTRASESNHTQIVVERAPRGRIMDRNGIVLAGDQPVFVALFSPLGLKPTQFQMTMDHLSEILKIPTAEIEKRLRYAIRAKTLMRVSDRLSRSQAFLILQDRLRLPGISLTIEEQRFYPNEAVASHILGYVGQITDDDLDRLADQGYRSGDWIGKTGLERLYDPTLHGQDGGILIQVDARGRQVRILRHVLPQAGRDLILTLDQKLQELAETRLKESNHPGAAVVLNPQTGEVLALASAPGYNPNVFLPLGNSDERRALIQDNELKPLYNRAIQAFYPPGSTFKPISALAALERHVIKPDELIYCGGSFTLGKDRRVFKCWKPHGHGYVDFLHAMAQSCDVYFYHLGLLTGPNAIERMAELFGLGKKTGIDLPNENSRPLPMSVKGSRHEYWQGGHTLNYAIGQGDLLVTPLQMAQVAEVLGNKGSIWQPYLAKESRRFSEPPQPIGGPHLVSRVAFSEEALDLVRDGMKEVVASGTGLASQIKGIEVSGKTGTAQASKGGDHAWFISYAPAEDPRVACAVVVEHGGHGGVVAAPIAHDLMAFALGANPKDSIRREVTSD